MASKGINAVRIPIGFWLFQQTQVCGVDWAWNHDSSSLCFAVMACSGCTDSRLLPVCSKIYTDMVL